jgi:hypothetical protein
MGRVARVVVLTLAVVLAGVIVQPAWAGPPLPSSMAAIGDSITRAYDVCCSYGDHPGQSWSTGSTGYDGIASHYERIKQLNPVITGHGYTTPSPERRWPPPRPKPPRPSVKAPGT